MEDHIDGKSHSGDDLGYGTEMARYGKIGMEYNRNRMGRYVIGLAMWCHSTSFEIGVYHGIHVYPRINLGWGWWMPLGLHNWENIWKKCIV